MLEFVVGQFDEFELMETACSRHRRLKDTGFLQTTHSGKSQPIGQRDRERNLQGYN